VGLDWGPLNPVSTTEELPERKSSRSDLENRDCGRRGSVRHLSIRKSWYILTLPISGGRSVGIVRSQAKATESYYYYYYVELGFSP
jgi:hypothetical protein